MFRSVAKAMRLDGVRSLPFFPHPFLTCLYMRTPHAHTDWVVRSGSFLATSFHTPLRFLSNSHSQRSSTTNPCVCAYSFTPSRMVSFSCSEKVPCTLCAEVRSSLHVPRSAISPRWHACVLVNRDACAEQKTSSTRRSAIRDDAKLQHQGHTFSTAPVAKGGKGTTGWCGRTDWANQMVARPRVEEGEDKRRIEMVERKREAWRKGVEEHGADATRRGHRRSTRVPRRWAFLSSKELEGRTFASFIASMRKQTRATISDGKGCAPSNKTMVCSTERNCDPRIGQRASARVDPSRSHPPRHACISFVSTLVV